MCNEKQPKCPEFGCAKLCGKKSDGTFFATCFDHKPNTNAELEKIERDEKITRIALLKVAGGLVQSMNAKGEWTQDVVVQRTISVAEALRTGYADKEG